jgi:hypothetical protein
LLPLLCCLVCCITGLFVLKAELVRRFQDHHQSVA